MEPNLLDKISPTYKDYKIEKIQSGASHRLFYRLTKDEKTFICLDSGKEKKAYKDFIKIHSYLSKVDVSIPCIYENDDNNNILILEDFGNLRFDKILNNFPLKNLLESAVKTLVILKNDISFDLKKNLSIYNYNTFKSEISEFPNFYYYFVYNKKISIDLLEEFYFCWKKNFDLINFDFINFVHKDFNVNNLMYLPSRKTHFKCGILDFQSAFWGDCCWDLFSLLEDSRVFFDDQLNDYFIKLYYQSTNQNIEFEEFVEKYYILNCSRQTRLLGRWVKLSKDLNQRFYLSFIETTKKRLIKSLEKAQRKDLKNIYKKLFPGLF